MLQLLSWKLEKGPGGYIGCIMESKVNVWGRYDAQYKCMSALCWQVSVEVCSRLRGKL